MPVYPGALPLTPLLRHNTTKVRLRDSYDIPDEVARGPHSPAFAKFLCSWFGNTMALSRRELGVAFLDELTAEELASAKRLLRRNLKLRQVHIIEGVWMLHDTEATPMLRAMLAHEIDPDWRLTISGALWKLAKDPIFVQCLNQARKVRTELLTGSHMAKVLWLDDDLALDLLIDLLNHPVDGVAYNALDLLNRLEFDRRYPVPTRELRRQPDDYRRRRNGPVFRGFMVHRIHKWNEDSDIERRTGLSVHVLRGELKP